MTQDEMTEKLINAIATSGRPMSSLQLARRFCISVARVRAEMNACESLGLVARKRRKGNTIVWDLA